MNLDKLEKNAKVSLIEMKEVLDLGTDKKIQDI
jgi:hypothetical protein